MADRTPSQTVRKSILGHAALITLSAVFLIPFAWLLTSSFKSEAHLFSKTPEWVPRAEYFEQDNGEWREVGFPIDVLTRTDFALDEDGNPVERKPDFAKIRLLDGAGDPIMKELFELDPPENIADMDQGIIQAALSDSFIKVDRTLPPMTYMSPVVFGSRWEIPVRNETHYVITPKEGQFAAALKDGDSVTELFTADLPAIGDRDPENTLKRAFAERGIDPPEDSKDIKKVFAGQVCETVLFQEVIYIVKRLGDKLHIYTDETSWKIVPHAQVETKPWPTARHYAKGVQGFNFVLFLQNTLFIVTLTIVGTLLSCSWIAFGFSILEWRGRNKVFYLMLATMMLPPQVTMIPMFVIFKNFGWINTYAPLIVPSFLGNAFFVFLLRQFFLTIPKDLIDAARVDGCSTFRIFWQLVLPLSVPVLATVALFTFMGSWNDFMGPLIYVVDEAKYTLSLGLVMFKGRFASRYGEMMAVSVLLTIPIIVLFFFTQKTFIQGIKTSGMKG